MIIWVIWKYDQMEGSQDILRAFLDFEKASTFLRNYSHERGYEPIDEYTTRRGEVSLELEELEVE